MAGLLNIYEKLVPHSRNVGPIDKMDPLTWHTIGGQARVHGSSPLQNMLQMQMMQEQAAAEAQRLKEERAREDALWERDQKAQVDMMLMKHQLGDQARTTKQKTYEYLLAQGVEPEEARAMTFGTGGRRGSDKTTKMKDYNFLISQGMTPDQALAHTYKKGSGGDGGIMGGGGSKAFNKMDQANFESYRMAQQKANAMEQIYGQLEGMPDQGLDASLVKYAPWVVDVLGKLGSDHYADMGATLEATERVKAMAMQDRPEGSGVMTDKDFDNLLTGWIQAGNYRMANAVMVEVAIADAEYKRARGQMLHQMQQSGEVSSMWEAEDILDKQVPYPTIAEIQARANARVGTTNAAKQEQLNATRQQEQLNAPETSFVPQGGTPVDTNNLPPNTILYDPDRAYSKEQLKGMNVLMPGGKIIRID